MTETATPFTMSEQDNAAFLAMQESEPPKRSRQSEPEEIEAEIPADKPVEKQVSKTDPDEPDSVSEAVETDPDTGEVKKKKTYVPQEALHEERLKRKAIEQKLRDAEMVQARFDERLRVIQEMNRQPEPAPVQEDIPDESQDPMAAIAWLKQQLLNERQAKSSQTAEQQAEQARQRDLETFKQAYVSKAQEFAREEPNFDDAYNYLIEGRKKDLSLSGYDPASIANIVQQEEINFAHAAMQRGENPAKVAMEMAKNRGWTAKGKATTLDQAEARIDAISDAQARNKSLSSTGTSVSTMEMTGTRLSKMSNADFDAWVSKNPKKAKLIMGG